MGVETIWRTHCAKILLVAEAMTDERLACSATPRGRTVGAHLAHVQSVRIEWLKSARKDAAGLPARVTKERAGDRAALTDGLAAAGEAVALILEDSAAAGSKVRGFGGGAEAFLAYLIAHEWYHLGKIALILDLSGLGLDDKLAYGLWERWGAGEPAP